MKPILPALFLLAGCEPNNIEQPDDGLGCGAGTHEEAGVCVPDALDTADSGDTGDTGFDTDTGSGDSSETVLTPTLGKREETPTREETPAPASPSARAAAAPTPNCRTR